MNRALVIHRRNMSKKIKIVIKAKQRKRILDVTETTNKQRTFKYILDKLFDFSKTLNSAPNPEEFTCTISLYTEDVNV